LHDFGAMHIDRDPARAELHLHEALEVFARQGNAAGQGYALLNLTQLCIGRGDTRQAQDFLERTTRLCEQHTLNDIESFTLMQRGCLQLEAGRLEVADELFCKARERSQAHGGRPLSEVMPFMVDLYRRQGRLPEMRTILETHLEAMMERDQLPFAMQAHELLTDVLEELGDIGGALRHSRSHLRLFRQVYHAEQEDKVRALEVLHRTQLAQRNAEEERRKNVQLKTALDQLEEQTRSALEAGWTDELTGLRNRRYLTNLDVRAWSGQAFAVAMVDLDYFKAVNDRYGHPVGDAVLREFAALLKHRVRDHDIVARFGGEEFVILFPATALEVAASALERLSAELRAHVWNALDSSQRLTFTAGIAVCADGDLEDAMTRADRLLYAGKASGRNTLRLERALF
jgi:diguanylate cyclase (GGDEF)-like protein